MRKNKEVINENKANINEFHECPYDPKDIKSNKRTGGYRINWQENIFWFVLILAILLLIVAMQPMLTKGAEKITTPIGRPTPIFLQNKIESFNGVASTEFLNLLEEQAFLVRAVRLPNFKISVGWMILAISEKGKVFQGIGDTAELAIGSLIASILLGDSLTPVIDCPIIKKEGVIKCIEEEMLILLEAIN